MIVNLLRCKENVRLMITTLIFPLGDEMETEIINGLKSESEPTGDKHVSSCRKRHTGKRHHKRQLSGEEPIPDKKKTMTALIAEEAVEDGNVSIFWGMYFYGFVM